MSRRVVLVIVVLIGLLVGAWLVPSNNRVKLVGWLRGEHFHEGMPTHYWLDAMESPEGNLRHTAMRAVAHEKAAIPALTRRLNDEAPQLRRIAAAELSGFGAEAKEAVPALVEMLKDDDRACRQAAEEALERIDPDALRQARGG